MKKFFVFSMFFVCGLFAVNSVFAQSQVQEPVPVESSLDAEPPVPVVLDQNSESQFPVQITGSFEENYHGDTFVASSSPMYRTRCLINKMTSKTQNITSRVHNRAVKLTCRVRCGLRSLLFR